MIAISSLLSRERILLHPEVPTSRDAVAMVAALLRSDPQVLSWEKLFAGLLGSGQLPCASLGGCDFGVCIPHVRTKAVSGMVMGMGRFDRGLHFEGCPTPVRYIFCIGLPPAMNADYLAVVGLLTRFLRSPDREAVLRTAESPAEALAGLARFQSEM